MTMHRMAFIVILISSIIFGNSAIAKTPAFPTGNFDFMQSKQAELARYMLTPATGTGLGLLAQATDSTSSKAVVPFEIIKKPGRALFFSAVIPGAGQIYSESYITGAAYIAAEIALWVFYSKYHSKGEDLETIFVDFANEHWNAAKYREWIESEEAQNLDVQKTHDLPETKTQQYYEMIGKYNQFFKGWDDSENYTYGEELSPNRLDYMDMREDSNIELKRATTMVSIAILNHIVSAVDAAWRTYLFNKNYASKHGTSLRFETMQYANQLCPAVSLNMRW